MPYIVTTIEQRHLDELGIESVATSRRAVATLDEARDHALSGLDTAMPGEWTPEWQSLATDISRISESFASFGPLPDGTVIEVERVPAYELYHAVGSVCDSGSSHWKPLPEIIAAYNAKEDR